MAASLEQCRLQHFKHGRGQFGQVRYDAAVLRQKLVDGIGLDADAVDLHVQSFCLSEGVVAWGDSIWRAVCQDQDDFPLLLQRTKTLQYPPEGRRQRRAAGSGYAEVLRHFFPMTDKGKD